MPADCSKGEVQRRRRRGLQPLIIATCSCCLLAENCQFFTNPSLIRSPPLRMFPANFVVNFTVKKLYRCAILQWRPHDCSLSHFDIILACNGETDWRSTACTIQPCLKLCWRAAKTWLLQTRCPYCRPTNTVTALTFCLLFSILSKVVFLFLFPYIAGIDWTWGKGGHTWFPRIQSSSPGHLSWPCDHSANTCQCWRGNYRFTTVDAHHCSLLSFFSI